MSSTDYLQLLEDADDPVHSEWPGGHLDRSRERRFRAFATDLVAELGRACVVETGADIQDASFVGSVTLPSELRLPDRSAQVRVGHFGSFMALLDSDDAVSPEILSAIQSIAVKHNYLWIPSDVLQRPYTGANSGVSGFRDWGARFFDWI